MGRAVPSDFTQVLEAELTYPLLRNRGVQINRIPVMLARINEDVSLDVLEQRVRDLVMQVETAYWELYCSYRIFDVNKAGRDAAFDVWQIDKSKVPQQSPGEAEGRSEEQYHSFQNQVIATFAGSRVTNEDGILGRESLLRYLMGLEATDNQGLIRPSDEPTLAKVSFDWEAAKAEALYRSPELTTTQTPDSTARNWSWSPPRINCCPN